MRMGQLPPGPPMTAMALSFTAPSKLRREQHAAAAAAAACKVSWKEARTVGQVSRETAPSDMVLGTAPNPLSYAGEKMHM